MENKEYIIDKLLDKSEIYMVTNIITNKKYIGQSNCFYNKNGMKIRNTVENRWKHHLYDAKNSDRKNGARKLIESIRTYGKDNHTVVPLLICNNHKADYFERKFIKDYNTQTPNGLNIMKGGKKCPLEEETKKKLSESKKGKYTGEQNPMWNKKHSKETRKKIKDFLTGRPLNEKCKASMSRSHQQNLINGKLPPRRKYNDLPKYIYHVKSSNKEGYEIKNHPTLKSKQFVMKSISLKENLKRAIDYLNDPCNPNNQKEIVQVVKYTNLPRYVRQINTEKLQGFEVKNHPIKSNKKWTTNKLSMDEKFKLVKEYLEN